MPKPIEVGPHGKPFTPPIVSLALPPAPEPVSVEESVPLPTEETENSGRTIHRFIVNQGPSGGNLQVAAGIAGRRHQVIGFILAASGNGTIQFLSGTGPTIIPLTGQMDLANRGSLVWPSNPSAPFVETAVGERLSITTPNGGGVRGMIIYLTV